MIFKDGYQKSKDSWFPGVMGIASGILFFFVPLPHGTFSSIRSNSASSMHGGSKSLLPLIDQQVYNGVCGLVGTAGATFLLDEEPESTVVPRSLGGFLVGFAAWMFLPRSFTCAWDNRATTCWDVLWIALNASFVTVGLTIAFKPTKLGKKVFGATLLGISTFFFLPQDIRNMIIDK
ncbi:hypothetical protein EON65_00240 [archaeon]|nr:MAG: hypothetical protein EON65_00240 [archaeon]